MVCLKMTENKQKRPKLAQTAQIPKNDTKLVQI